MELIVRKKMSPTFSILLVNFCVVNFIGVIHVNGAQISVHALGKLPWLAGVQIWTVQCAHTGLNACLVAFERD